jgi:hypothetical protein
MPHEVALRRVLYEIPGMRDVRVVEDEFSGANGEPIPMRIYMGAAGAAPPVIIVEGFPDAAYAAHVGSRFMDIEWSISMAHLLAASDLTAITYAPREPEADAVALIAHLRKTNPRIGIWSTSGNSPVALVVAAHVTCAVLNNPIIRDFCPDTPLLVIRAGQDENPGLNAALDAFVARALADNRALTLVNYPSAPHSYELYLDTPETHRILQQGLEFLRAHLV